MRTVEWCGTLTALSSIAHSDEAAGTIHQFRRETMIQPDGRVIKAVPVISGGTIRGEMRRIAAKMMQHAIVGPDGRLPFDVVHTLRTGGALRETKSAGEVLTGERQAVVRDRLPMLSVFGFNTRGRIVSGRLYVDKAIPCSQETAWLAPYYGVEHPASSSSIWSLTTQERYARVGQASETIDAGGVDLSGGSEVPKGAGAMLWTHEVLPIGTALFHSIRIEDATAAEVAFMDDVIRRWCAKGRIGAMRARGLGRFAANYTRKVTDVMGDEASDEPAVDWRAATQDNLDEVREALQWL